jgi:predicted extracellular nuclease
MRRYLATVLSIPLLAAGLAGAAIVSAIPAEALAAAGSSVFINEIHYDNTGTDTGEFVEIAGPATTDLTGWDLVLYNGSNGTVYNTTALTGTITDQGGGAGTVAFTYPSNGLQNGSPDGIALVDNGTLVQFLSYEGQITGVGGAADGVLSTDIGVSEPGTTPIGDSLQLIGTGTLAGDFTWSGPSGESPGATNTGQMFSTAATTTVWINEIHYDNTGADAGEFVEIAGTAGAALTGWAIEFYNGSNGTLYDTITLDAATIDDEASGIGALSFLNPGIQNGSPDGLALVNNGTVVEFLSYEGTLLATTGAAAGQTSTDIGVSEPGSPVGQSLQRTGSGATGAEFTWTGPIAESPGDLNAGQTIGTPPASGSLVFSQYIEGSSNNKAIELQNRSSAAIDMSTVLVEAYNNGNTTVSNSFSSGTGVLAPGDVYVIANSSANSLILSVADATSAVTFFNGDDALLLSVDGTPIDMFGTIGTDPGSQWSGGGVSTQNESICRRDEITTGNPAGFTDPSLEWDGFPINTTDGLGTSDCTTPIPPVSPCIGGGTVPIHIVQGSGASTPCGGDIVTVQGIVTSLFERDDALDGFFLQEEDAQADADPSTSEGVFVFCRADCPTVAPGHDVTVTGEAEDFFGMTQVDAGFGSGTFVMNSTGNVLPSASALTLPASAATNAEATYESVEGMLVTFPGTLVVSEYFQLSRFGQVTLTPDARIFQYTHTNTPDEAGFNAFTTDLATRQIILDDDNNDQNEAISDGPDEGYYQAGGPLTTTNVFRGGDTIDGLTGVMHWSFAGSGGTDSWRIRPTPQVFDYEFTAQNVRPASPDNVGGDLTVASFNVLNFFTTIDDGSNSGCGPTGVLGCRGAHSLDELNRQRSKIVSALAEIDADIVGLIEIENNEDASVVDLVGGLNAVVGAGTYDYVDTGTIGSDAIKVAFIYKPATVSPAGAFDILSSSNSPVDGSGVLFDDSRNRPMLTQTFDEVGTHGRFTVSVNHLKSKGSRCGTGDDAADGSGNCNGTRTRASEAIVEYLNADPTGSGDSDFLVMGDLNAYKMETPISTLTDAGYTDVIDSFVGPDAYSFVFSAQLGYLDHALANSPLLPQITGVTEWHINADEVNVYDYNDDVQDGGERSFERISETPAIYTPDAFRSSDHDPVVIGLSLEASYECGGARVTVGELEALGYNVIVGSEGHDQLWGTDGNDAIISLGGNDHIFAKDGDDLVCSGDGDDLVVADRGNDVVEGGAGNDLLIGGRDDDSLDGGEGHDIAIGNRGFDTCTTSEFSLSCEA